MYQAILPSAHIPLTGVSTPIFIMAPLRYFSNCFPLAFLEDCCLSSSLAAIFLHLDPITWDPSALSNRVASFSSISSQSHWRYSTILLFLSSSSTTLCLSASSLVFSSTSLLTFWAMCSAQRNFAASFIWTRSHCSSSYLCYISRILASFCKISEWAEEDIIIQKQEQKTSFFIYILLT